MKTFKVTILAIAALMSASTISAQDEVEADVSADIVSNYVWRGAKLDDAAIQPSAGISYKGLSLTAWGSYGLTSNTGTTSELDLTAAYSAGSFNIGITDYWCNAEKYFLYDAHKTAHVFEANIGYDFGPLSLQWYTNFAGADGVKDNGDRAYMSYVELTAPFKLGGLDWSASIGAIPYCAYNGFYAANTSGDFAVNNIALKVSKDLKVTDSFTIPVFGQIATNPSTQAAYFVIGFTIQP